MSFFNFSITPEEYQKNKNKVLEEFDNLVKKFIGYGHNPRIAETKALLFQLKQCKDEVERI